MSQADAQASVEGTGATIEGSEPTLAEGVSGSLAPGEVIGRYVACAGRR